MAIDSVGYDGQVTESEWAQLASAIGTPYAVVNPNDFAVTVNVSADRTVNIAAGIAYGHGVLDTSDATATVQLPIISSGSRWDLICMRRNWLPPGGESELTSVQGNATRVIPVTGRSVTPGVQDDQPLALVQVTAGQSLPTAIVDLRIFASKVLTVSDLIALPDPAFGAEAVVAGLRYRREKDITGNTAWVQKNKLASLRAPWQSVTGANHGTNTWYSPIFDYTIAGGYSTFGAGISRTDRVFTVAQAGLYQIEASFAWGINTAGQRHARIYLNPSVNSNPAAGASPTGVCISHVTESASRLTGYNCQSLQLATMYRLNAGDKVVIYCQQTAGVSVPLLGNNNFTYIAIHRLGDL